MVAEAWTLVGVAAGAILGGLAQILADSLREKRQRERDQRAAAREAVVDAVRSAHEFATAFVELTIAQVTAHARAGLTRSEDEKAKDEQDYAHAFLKVEQQREALFRRWGVIRATVSRELGDALRDLASAGTTVGGDEPGDLVDDIDTDLRLQAEAKHPDGDSAFIRQSAILSTIWRRVSRVEDVARAVLGLTG